MDQSDYGALAFRVPDWFYLFAVMPFTASGPLPMVELPRHLFRQAGL